MNSQIRLLFVVAVLASVPSCSYIKSWFPDKEKDYQFTTEIPPLVLPADLAGDSNPKISVAETATEAPAAPVSDSVDDVPAYKPSDSPAETALAVERKLIQVELVDAGEGTKRLRIGAPLATAWRILGKALSRKSIEVTDRNQEEGIFHILYDQSKQDVEDGSFWDEIVFALKGFDVDEYAYVLKLVDNNQQSDIIIMDKEQKPIADQPSLRLLSLLHDTIKADLAK
jgi:outer membrane protein assembly factor BamC